MLFFRGEEDIDMWRTQWSQPRGATLTIDQAWKLAVAWYANKMNPNWCRATLDETEALVANLGRTGPFGIYELEDRTRSHLAEKSMLRLARAVEELLVPGRPAFTHVLGWASS
jgi:hypothetical protein